MTDPGSPSRINISPGMPQGESCSAAESPSHHNLVTRVDEDPLVDDRQESEVTDTGSIPLTFRHEPNLTKSGPNLSPPHAMVLRTGGSQRGQEGRTEQLLGCSSGPCVSCSFAEL